MLHWSSQWYSWDNLKLFPEFLIWICIVCDIFIFELLFFTLWTEDDKPLICDGWQGPPVSSLRLYWRSGMGGSSLTQWISLLFSSLSYTVTPHPAFPMSQAPILKQAHHTKFMNVFKKMLKFSDSTHLRNMWSKASLQVDRIKYSLDTIDVVKLSLIFPLKFAVETTTDQTV